MWKQDIFLQRIEAGGAGIIGVPDLFFHVRGTKQSGWIELKELVFNKTLGLWRTPFRPGQLPWITRFRKIGGVVMMVATTPDDSWFMMVGQEIKLEYECDELNEYNVGKLDVEIFKMIIGL